MHRRKSNRLHAFDYASAAEYFVTICTEDRECHFGEIKSGKMRLSHIGQIARKCWADIPDHFPNVELDEYEVMPNHMHGIVRVKSRVGTRRRGVQLNAPTEDHSRLSPKKGTLSVILRTYKAAITTLCREQGFTYFGWLQGFHDHIIRNQGDLNRIRKYIRDNVKNWEADEENPKVIVQSKNHK